MPDEVELDDLLLQWYDSKDTESINAIIRQGLADIESGKGKPADDVSQELRSKFGFPEVVNPSEFVPHSENRDIHTCPSVWKISLGWG